MKKNIIYTLIFLGCFRSSFGIITGAINLCPNTTHTYVASLVPGAVSYSWTNNLANSVSSSNSNTLILTCGASGGIITVQAYDNNNNLVTQNLGVYIIPPPTTNCPITGTFLVCPYTYQYYFGWCYNITQSYVGNHTSNWTFPPGWTVWNMPPPQQSNANSFVNPNALSGIITTNRTYECGYTQTQTVAVTVVRTDILGNIFICPNSTNTYTATPVLGATSYTWTLPNGWTGVSNSNTITTTANANSGTITVSATSTLCNSLITQTIGVYTTPQTGLTINGNTITCPGALNTYTASQVAGATNYTWTLPNSWTGTSNTYTIDITSGLSPGTITVSALDACNALVTQTLAISITPPSQLSPIIGPTLVCVGSTNNYKVNPDPSISGWNWTLPQGWPNTSNTNMITSTANPNSGFVTVSGVDACGNMVSQSVSVTVLTPQPIGGVMGNTLICPGTQNTYSILPIQGANYNWSLPGSWNGSSGTYSINATAGGGSGIVSVQVYGVCNFPVTQTLDVTVNGSQPLGIIGNNLICPGTTNSFTAGIVPGAPSYTWSLPSGFIGTSTTNSIAITTAPLANSGVISVSAINTCGILMTQNLAINVFTPQTGLGVVGNPTPCPGSTNIYTATPISGATSYTWTLPGGLTGNSSLNSISTLATGTVSGIVSVSAIDYCGSVVTQTLWVDVVSAQTGTIVGPSVFCPGNGAGDGMTYYAIIPGANINGVYNWTLPPTWLIGFPGSPYQNPISCATGSAGGIISVSAMNGCGALTTLSMAVTPSVPPPSILGSTVLCQGVGSFYITNTTLSNYQQNATWTLPSGWSQSVSGYGLIITPNGASGTVTVATQGACGASYTVTLPITVVPPPPNPSVLGNFNVCPNSTNTYTVINGGAGPFNWYLPGICAGAYITPTNTVSIPFSNSVCTPSYNNLGTFTVTGTNICGSSFSQTFLINSYAAQTNLNILGNNPICQNSTNTYTATAVNGASSYTWTLPSGWTGSSTTNTISVTANNAPGILTVQAIGQCSFLITQTLAINLIPPQTNLSINGSQWVCPGSSFVYTAGMVTGATSYNWNFPSGWIVNASSANNVTVTANSNTGPISVSAIDACGYLITQTLNTNPLPYQTLGITGNTLACYTIPNTFTATPVFGATSYIWSLPSGWTGTSAMNIYTSNLPGAAGIITVSAINSCGVLVNQTLAVNVYTPQYTSSITGPTLVCAGSVFNYTAGNVTGSSSYTWANFNGPLGGSSSSTLISITAPSTSTLQILNVNAADVCGIQQNAVLYVTVILPQTTLSITGNSNVCPNTVNSYTAGSVQGATSYSWSLPPNWTGSSTTSVITVNVAQASGVLTVSAVDVCGITITQTLNVIIPPIQTNFGISGNTFVCVGNLNSYTATPVIGAGSYTWNLPTGWTGNSSTNIINCTTGNAPATISVSAFNGCAVITQTLAVWQNLNCCPQTNTPVLGSNVLVAGGSLTGPLIIDQNITISGNGNFIFQSGDFAIANNVQITVMPGVNLVLQDAHLYGCVNVWQGINVQDGGNITSSSPGPLGLSTLIEDAVLAIDLNNISANHATPLLNLDGVIFNRNYECIRIRNSTLSSIPLALRSCVFTNRDLQPASLSWPNSSYTSGLRYASSTATASSLDAPYMTNYPLLWPKNWSFSLPSAIKIQNIDNVPGGAPAAGVSWGTPLANEFNLFDLVQVGIYVEDASLTTYNNTFQNLGMTGIYHETSATMNARLSLTAPSFATGNRFWQNYWYAGIYWGGNWSTNGIIAENIFEFDIEKATFRGHSTNPNGTSGPGIYANSNRFNNYRIHNNIFSNQPSYGIYLSFMNGLTNYDVNGVSAPGIYAGSLNIDQNYFSPLPPLSTALTTTETIEWAMRIYGDNSVPWNIPGLNGNTVTQPNYINTNTISLATNGIDVYEMSNYPLGLRDNFIDLNYALKRTPNPQFGIYMNNTLGHKTIRTNTVQATGYNWNNLTYLFYCSNNLNYPEITCNLANNGYNGFYFSGTNRGVWSGNTMNNNQLGLHLDGASTTIGQPPTINSSRGNLWFGNSTDTWVDAPSSALASPLYVTQGTPEEPTNNFGAGTAPYSLTSGLSALFNFPPYECPSSTLLMRNSTTTSTERKVNENSDGLSLFPNPTAGELTIVGLSENSDIKIVDVTGKTVYTKHFTNNNLDMFDISSLANGIYMVEIKEGSQQTTKKLILAK